MRLMALLLTATLAGHAVTAQQAGPSPPAAPRSTEADATPAETRDLPVSLAKIRDGLARVVPPGLLLKDVQDTPTFRLEILERRKIEELLSTLDFKSGPKPPGGIYAYEQNRMLFPAVDNPLVQPYAAFNVGELAVVSAESVAENLLGAKYVAKALKNAFRSHQEEAARAEVERAIAEYCSSKPNGGAGIEMCAPPAASR
jgi:hypothetical protein